MPFCLFPLPLVPDVGVVLSFVGLGGRYAGIAIVFTGFFLHEYGNQQSNSIIMAWNRAEDSGVILPLFERS